MRAQKPLCPTKRLALDLYSSKASPKPSPASKRNFCPEYLLALIVQTSRCQQSAVLSWHRCWSFGTKRKAEPEAGLGGKQGGGRLRRLAGAAKDRLKQLDERLDGTDDGRLEPSVLFRLPTGVNATGQRGARGGGGEG